MIAKREKIVIDFYASYIHFGLVILFYFQKSNSEEALELLQMAISSCKTDVLPLISLYDELSALLERKNLQPTIIDWFVELIYFLSLTPFI